MPRGGAAEWAWGRTGFTDQAPPAPTPVPRLESGILSFESPQWARGVGSPLNVFPEALMRRTEQARLLTREPLTFRSRRAPGWEWGSGPLPRPPRWPPAPARPPRAAQPFQPGGCSVLVTHTVCRNPGSPRTGLCDHDRRPFSHTPVSPAGRCWSPGCSTCLPGWVSAPPAAQISASSRSGSPTFASRPLHSPRPFFPACFLHPAAAAACPGLAHSLCHCLHLILLCSPDGFQNKLLAPP